MKIIEVGAAAVKESLGFTPGFLGSLLSSYSKLRLYNNGRSVHSVVLKRQVWSSNGYLQNHLVNFYAKCEKLSCAHKLFDEIFAKNTITWTALISGYDQCGRCDKALKLFSLMNSQDPLSPPNEYTYASAISACKKQNCLLHGTQVHSHALKRGSLTHLMVSNALLSLYMSQDWVTEAELVFREIREPDEISWNSLITGFSQNGFFRTTIETFQRMRRRGIAASSFALSSLISACIQGEFRGRELHGIAIKTGLDADCFTGSALILMYARTKHMDGGIKVFETLDCKDVGSWNSLIEGYGESGEGEQGLHVFCNFLESGLKADEITMTTVLGICTKLVLLEIGKQVHALSSKVGLARRTCMGNSMIDMYAKCGNIEDGMKIFQDMEKKSTVSWTTMMGGLAYHGGVNKVLRLFEEMKINEVKPNRISYTCALSACAHGGLVDYGKSLFDSMEIEPEEEHYICMVHLLAGSRKFEEAEDFIERSPKLFKDQLWKSLLVACKNSYESEKGLEVAENIMKNGLPSEASSLVLLSHVFAAGGRWDEVEKLRYEIKQRGMKKEPGCSWIEICNCQFLI
ncbi:putative pentatricopeptide repeat-containing protein At5g13230, mitochondrial isoform X1 [Aristolochia californica]|uniref:putative pentatricopeptide repeat-containing protein At5g13230, mitochondrial isoform X1 n=1 Tax=Aristolochia californica TaxID=171875 RepID=UPI0035DFE159